MHKALLDTNILLDAAMPERPAHVAALLLLDEVAYGQLDGYVSALSLKDVYYVLAKYSTEPEARAYIKAAMDAFHIVSVDEAVCRISAESDEPDFEDGLIRACAESAEVDFVISRDKAAFQASRIKRLNAQEYVDLFCDVEEVQIERPFDVVDKGIADRTACRSS